MRVLAPIALVLVAACGGDITVADDVAGDDAPGDPDAQPADEPAGLVGTTAAHNQVRAALGIGPLTWDPALAAIAQSWASACVDNEAPVGLIDHNAGRSDTYPEYVGENIYGAGGGASGTDAVALWVSEEEDYDYASNTCSGVCGHYTQVVWRASTKLGCGISSCPGLTYGNSVVCNYAPGGNSGGRPY
jgi:uncharacterized protein YkwD